MRQLYNYSTVHDTISNIETPPDDYTPDKVTGKSMEEYQQERNKDLRQ